MLDAGTREMLRDSLRHLLTASDGPLRAELDKLGWNEVTNDDPSSALRLLFEVRGTTLSPADALGPVMSGVLAETTGEPGLLEANVVLPGSLIADRPSSSYDGRLLRIEGIALSVPDEGAVLIVPVDKDGTLGLAVVTSTNERTVLPIAGTDPSVGVSISAVADPSDVQWIIGEPASGIWQKVTATARWALATELSAIGHQVIMDAVEYTSQRRQYGRAIGSFQALQHRLAGAWASVAGADEVAAIASESGQAWDALVAKALAGRAAENACTQAQQCYGAIGFTWEHHFHRSLRRVYVLDRLFGDWRALEAEIGSALLAAGRAPKIGRI
jgi:hypothetical protein